ncbi:MAG: glycosyltransferase family 2 protein [Gemmataceae bacterium]|nr:glycosyltransferase family 2 protein [Gemmataceae bacterium]
MLTVPRPVTAPAPAPRQVPAFTTAEYAPRSADYCVCVFVINENGKLQNQLAAMRGPCAGTADVVVADGGSTDGSTAHDGLRALGVNTLLTKTGPGKLGAQMRMAFAWALDRGYRGVVSMDGNGKDGPDAIPRFIDQLRAGYDHVQGSRFIRGGVSEHLPFSRRVGVRFLHAPLISLASRYRYTDTTNGFRGYSRRFLEDPRVAVFRDVFPGYELHYYLAIRAARLGFRVGEIPVARRYPAHGPTPTKISPVRGNLRVLKCLFAACLGWYNP